MKAPQVRVLVPYMPTPGELAPYLREMEEAGVYTNGGPLVTRLEALVAEAVCAPWIPHVEACAVSSGTSALELALRALDRPRGTAVAVPALTFRATAQAVANAGMLPVYCDVDAARFQLRPDSVPEGVDVALPVAAYGLPLPLEEWERWACRYPERRVVMDCAGAFGDQQSPVSRQVQVCFSLHATKFLGAGEGGLVVGCRGTLDRVRQLASFGDVPGATNNRMSEYHAAVALASLAHAPYKALRLNRVATEYLRRLDELCPQVVSLRSQALGPRSSLFVVDLPDVPPQANARVSRALRDAGIETRMWYRPFPQELGSLAGSPQDMPPVTSAAARRHLGLPFHARMGKDDVLLVCRALSDAVSELLR